MEDQQNLSATQSLSAKDVAELKSDLTAIAEQQNLQIEIFIEMSKLVAHMVQTQREQIAFLEARSMNRA